MSDPGTGSRGSIHSLGVEERSGKRQILEEVDSLVGRGLPAGIFGDSGRQMGA